MDYKRISLSTTLHIDSLVSVHYLEYTRDFVFAGEKHDFWELVYVDRGRVFVTADAEEFVLGSKELFIHKPNEFHSIRCDGESVANVIVISFSSNSQDLYSIAGHIINCPENGRPLLATIVSEVKEAFTADLGDPHVKELIRNEHQPFACEQLIQLNLEGFLIRVIRSDWSFFKTVDPLDQQHFPSTRLKAICNYLEANVESRIMFEDVCEHCSIGASALKKLFRDNVGCGVMEYYGKLKIERAKQMIREQDMNYTQIADALHYTTVQYFSRHFKRCTQMTPSEYSESVKRFMQ